MSYLCSTCEIEIPLKRVEYYETTDYSEKTWTCIKCSTTPKVKGIYMGEVGTSELKLVRRVYKDSVNSIFDDSSKEDNDE